MSAQLRTLHLTACHDGGVLTYLRELAEGLSSEGHEIIIAGPRNTRLEKSLSILDGVRYVGLIINPMPAVTDATVLLRLRQIIHHESIDVVHSHSIKAGLLAAMVRSANGRVCYAYTPHMLHRSKTTRRSRLAYALERWATRRHDVLVLASETERTRYLECGMSRNGKTAIAYCGLDAGNLQESNPHYRRELGLSDEWPVIGTVSRLEQQKGIDQLIRSVKPVAERFPGLRVLIGGYGSMEQQLKSLARSEGVGDRVFFLGAVEDPYALLKDLDVFVLPSRWEGLPIALLEAGIAGIPVVATDVGAVREMLNDFAGWLVPADNIGSLAAGITECLLDKEEAALRSSRLREKVAMNCSRDAMISRIVGAYREGLELSAP